MKTRSAAIGAFGVFCLLGAYLLVSAQGLGKGADLGGLAGADAHCQALATSVGAGNRTWHAYMSTQARGNQRAVNARDRIGQGPWHNANGLKIANNLADLHGDTVELAQLGNTLNKRSAVTEKGTTINGVGDNPNRHDMLTGSKTDGTAYTDDDDHTCSNWTSSATGGAAQVGHHDRTGNTNLSWNSAHASRGCSQEALAASGGAGLFYCFAIN
jgi:hypothetical protein